MMETRIASIGVGKLGIEYDLNVGDAVGHQKLASMAEKLMEMPEVAGIDFDSRRGTIELADQSPETMRKVISYLDTTVGCGA
jgi:hypothetical protein